MSLARFRSEAEMPEPPRAASPLEGLASACALSELSAAFGHRGALPRGVFKYSSIAAAAEQRLAWEDAAIRSALS